MSRQSYRNDWDRRCARRSTGNRAAGKVINYMIFVLPRLAFWYTVKFIAIALWHLTTWIDTDVGRRVSHSQDEAPAIASIGEDSLADQSNSVKRRQHGTATEGWDQEWTRLLASAPDRPAEDDGSKPERHQPVMEESQIEHALNELDDEPGHVRRAVLARIHTDLVQLQLHKAEVAHTRHAILARIHTDLVQLQLHKAEVALTRRAVLARVHTNVVQLREARVAHMRHAILARIHTGLVQLQLHKAGVAQSREDARQLFAGDPRTMWAWADYVTSPHFLPVASKDARQVLAAIPPGDHVEIFAAVVISPGYPRRGNNALPQEARFAARTFGCWILPSPEQQAEIISDSNTKWRSSASGSIVDPVSENTFTMANGRNLIAYADKDACDRFNRGVGEYILRLPDSPLAPVPPELGTGLLRTSPESASPRRLLGDWHTAEDVALWHMSGPLGFFQSRLTGGVSDRGVDVEHPEAVAQVKMQANPVGSPQIRQLRGARPHLSDHIFYSTSGYTRAAIAEAAETGVALFVMDDSARVRPHGAHAKRLTLEGHQRHGGDDAQVAGYVNSVVQRVRKAHTNYGSSDAWWALREAHGADWERLSRAESYLKGAVAAVKWHPRIGAETHKAVVSHFRHADLCAAFFCQVLSVPYPGDEALGRRLSPTAADFY